MEGSGGEPFSLSGTKGIWTPEHSAQVGQYLATSVPGLVGVPQGRGHQGNDPVAHTVMGLNYCMNNPSDATHGLPKRAAQLLRLAFSFHDLGKVNGGKRNYTHQKSSYKIALPFLKQFSLTPEEHETVKTLIHHHHAFGDLFAHLRRSQDEVYKDPSDHGDGIVDEKKFVRIARTPEMGDLLARMWHADYGGMGNDGRKSALLFKTRKAIMNHVAPFFEETQKSLWVTQVPFPFARWMIVADV